MSTTYTKESIAALLSKNDMAVVKGLEALYLRQTADERSAQTTSHRNGMGFNGRDAGILSSFACQIADWRAEKVETGRTRFPFPLSPKQLVIARCSILKYTGQLAEVANDKAAAAAVELAAERVAIQAEVVEGEYDFGPAPVEAEDEQEFQSGMTQVEDELVTKSSTIRRYASDRGLKTHEVRLSPVNPSQLKGVGVVEADDDEDEYLSL